MPVPRHGDACDEVTLHFAAACHRADAAALREILAPGAVVISDGGGKVCAPIRPVHGADRVARLLAALLEDQPRVAVAVASVNGRAGLVLRRMGAVVAVISVTVDAPKVAVVWIVMNPDKLRPWNRPG